MKSIKRVLAIVMIMAMMFSLVAINASAETAWSALGGCLWSIDANGTLIIKPDTTAADPGQLPDGADNTNYTNVWTWLADEYRLEIKRVEIASGVKAGDSLAYMFADCENMESIELSGLITSGTEDMSNMFNSCLLLESLDLSLFDTSSVTNMSLMFGGCLKLVTLDLSSFDTANVTNMVGMFALCPELTTIYVGDKWSTASVTMSIDMFTNSAKLVGGKGTTYDSGHKDAEYARGDAGKSSTAPGYLTKLYKIAQTEAELTWEKGCCDILTVTSSATYNSSFANKILVDGTEVVEQDSSKDYKNYDIKSGSTKVIFTAGYLETLSVGKHSIEIVSEDGSAKGTFTIVEATKTEETAEEDQKIAQTSDDNAVGAFVALGVMAAAGYVVLKKKED